MSAKKEKAKEKEPTAEELASKKSCGRPSPRRRAAAAT